MKAGIVGGGIIGRLIAFLLYQKQWQVTLFDQNKNNCSSVAAGLLTPISELEKSEISIFQLGMEALKGHWPTILAQLDEPVYFQRQGSLVVAHAQDQAELASYIRLISNKLNSTTFFKYLTPNAISTLEPELSLKHNGYYFPDEGQLDSQRIMDVLKKNLLTKIKWIDNQFVEAIKPEKIITSKTVYSFDRIFDCRGLGARSMLSNLRGVRGELLWLHAPEITITRPIRLLHPRYRLYIVPRPQHIYLLGSTEIESEDNSAISVRTTLELLTAAYSLQPKFSEARLVKTATACRPAFNNHLPKISYSKGIFIINGLYRHGFLVAPSLAEDVMRFIDKGIASVHYPHLWESL
ncbi:MAG: glycine oxidase ThiO [Pseudomonadota bacterium]